MKAPGKPRAPAPPPPPDAYMLMAAAHQQSLGRLFPDPGIPNSGAAQ